MNAIALTREPLNLRKAAIDRLPVLVTAVVVLAVVAGMLATPAFLTPGNLRALVQSAALTGIVAVTMTPMAMSGNFVSLGTQQSMVLGSMLFVWLVGRGVQPLLVVVLVGLVLALTGAAQGVAVAAGLNPVVTTLAFGVVVLGLIQTVNSTGVDITVGAHSVSWGSATLAGIPIQVLVLVLVTAAVTLLMSATVAGRRIKLTGANRETARMSGIDVRAVTIGAFVLAAAGMGLAGALGGAQFGQAGVGNFDGMTFAAVSAILVGGTSIAGGTGSPWRSAFGALVIAAIGSLMTLNDLPPGHRRIVEGLLVITIVVAIEFARRERSRA